MQHSESLKNLAGALSKAQAEMPVASENAKNPHLGNKYADLGAIIAAARPVLAKHGLAVSQFPMSDGGNVGVETILLHESGEWMSNTMLMDTSTQKGLNDAQVVGLTISYFRRYAFAAVLAIYTGDDTDGSTGKGKTEQKSINDEAPVTAANIVALEWVKEIPHATQLINLLGIGKWKMGDAKRLYAIYRPWRVDGKLEPAAAAAKAQAGEVYQPKEG